MENFNSQERKGTHFAYDSGIPLSSYSSLAGAVPPPTGGVGDQGAASVALVHRELAYTIYQPLVGVPQPTQVRGTPIPYPNAYGMGELQGRGSAVGASTEYYGVLNNGPVHSQQLDGNMFPSTENYAQYEAGNHYQPAVNFNGASNSMSQGYTGTQGNGEDPSDSGDNANQADPNQRSVHELNNRQGFNRDHEFTCGLRDADGSHWQMCEQAVSYNSARKHLKIVHNITCTRSTNKQPCSACGKRETVKNFVRHVQERHLGFRRNAPGSRARNQGSEGSVWPSFGGSA